MFEITIWDVNHGSAAYIKTPNDRHIVVDLGDGGEDFSPLRTLHTRGVKQLDAVVITHPHSDHMDDIFNLPLLAPKTLWTPRHLTEADIWRGNRIEDIAVVRRYLEIRQHYTSPLTPDVDLTAQEGFGGATFQVFTPRLCDSGNLNNHSLVVVVSYAGLKMVIPGDNEAPAWRELLDDRTFVAAARSADILLASHHGREAGYCAELFDLMGKPRLVVVSDGRFGETSATDRYNKQATSWTVFDARGESSKRSVLTTRKDGHITIKFGLTTNDPHHVNFLNVTTSRVDMAALVAKYLGI